MNFLNFKKISETFFEFFSTYEEAASSLEIRDHKLRTTLETMYIDGVFNDSIVILMGDHDDHQQHASSSIASYVQPAEMQTPLMSIHIPSPFRMHHPKQWEMVQLNRNRLT